MALSLGCVALGALGAVVIDELFDDDYREVQVVTVPATAPAPAAPAAVAPSGLNTAPGGDDQMISPARAGEIAAEAAGGQIMDVYPGFEDGRSVFNVDVRTPNGLAEVYVDSRTGEVIKVQQGS